MRHFVFTIQIGGSGEDEAEAWDSVIDGLNVLGVDESLKYTRAVEVDYDAEPLKPEQKTDTVEFFSREGRLEEPSTRMREKKA